LNPINVTNDDTHKPICFIHKPISWKWSGSTTTTICFGKEEVFTASEPAAVISPLKYGKVVGEDEIRSEMLNALNSEGIV